MRSVLPISTATLLALLCVLAAPPARAAPPTEVDLLLSALPPAGIQARLNRYVRTDLRVKGGVPDELVPMLAPLRRAADGVDRVFWQQVSPEGLQMLEVLGRSAQPEAQALARLLAVHYGPWDTDGSPFVGHRRRPAGAGFYPRDTSSRELDEWAAQHGQGAGALFSPYTVVTRSGRGFEPIPYAKAFAADLQPAAAALREAAAAYRCDDKRPGACKCKGMTDFLRARADALVSDRYEDSELLWLQQGDCPLDLAIGPYEFYEDRLLGLKAAFEAILYYRDAAESARFQRLVDLHKELVAALPVPAHVRARFDAVRPSPVVIGDVLYTAGDARAGYQIRAFSLPNDERIRASHGSRNVILRNVARARFDHLARPVAVRLFEPDLADQVTFDAYLQFLVTWQLSHGLVPKPIEASDGTRATARQLLRARYDVVQSVQGEVVALLNLLHLHDKGVLAGSGDVALAATWLASLIDALRIAEPSPRVVAKTIVYNFLARQYAIRYQPDTATFAIGRDAIRPAIRQLAAETMEILARGDYEGAGRLIVGYGLMPGELREKIEALGDLPVDILPTYASMPKAETTGAVASGKP